MKAAFCHDWLNGMRGGEKCLEALCELYPASPIYTLFCERSKISPSLASRHIIPSRLQKFPGIRSRYRHFLPLYPWAIEGLDASEFDLIISTSHCAAKGIRKRVGALHVCYCFTPARYVWSHFDEYFGSKNAMLKAVIRHFLSDFKRWDSAVNERVDHFIAISRHVQTRIREYYGREAEVIYPPVDTDFYFPDPEIRREGFFLIVSALVPYKRLDLAVRVFAESGQPLVVIGDGPEAPALKKAAPKNIRFLGWQPDEILRDHYRRARALIFPGEEDFGIVPVEAQACGCPVIALGQGGALETVHDGVSGVLYGEAEGLRAALERFETLGFDAAATRANALRFGRQRFKDEMSRFIASKS